MNRIIIIASQSEKEPNYSPLIANVQPLQSPQSGRLDQSGSESGYPEKVRIRFPKNKVT